jgi:hypothetical protein
MATKTRTHQKMKDIAIICYIRDYKKVEDTLPLNLTFKKTLQPIILIVNLNSSFNTCKSIRIIEIDGK